MGPCAEIDDYLELFSSFVEGRITVGEFERTFLARFSGERGTWRQEVYEVLNGVFLDVDAFYDGNGNVIGEVIDSKELLRRVGLALDKLRRSTTSTAG